MDETMQTNNREWCSGSSLAVPFDLVDNLSRQAPCVDCGQHVHVKLIEESWVRDWHLRESQVTAKIEISG
jgi:hypothetical protein